MLLLYGAAANNKLYIYIVKRMKEIFFHLYFWRGRGEGMIGMMMISNGKIKITKKKKTFVFF